MASPTSSIADLIHVTPIRDLNILPYHPLLHKNQAPGAGSGAAAAAAAAAASTNAAPQQQHQQQQQQQQNPPLNEFIASALAAAQSLAKEAASRSSNGAGTKHKSEGYNGTVVCERWDASVSASSSSSQAAGSSSSTIETWAVRRSRHRGQAAKGDATYDELAQTVWHNHSVNERDYTPTVKDANRVVAWDAEQGLNDGQVAGWQGCTMEIFESRHDIGPVLSNRVFTFLIVTGSPSSVSSSSSTTEARAAGNDAHLRSFVVLSIPIELPSSVEGLQYGTAKNVVHGAYASVETVTELTDAGEDKIEWVMATASDAKGNLPMALQKRFIKGEVAKDVGLVLKWIASKR